MIIRLSVLLALSAALTLFAEKFVLLFPAGPALQPDEYQTVRYLLMDNLRKATGGEVAAPADSAAVCESPDCVRQAVEAGSADKAVSVTVRKLGQKLIYGLALHGKDGAVISTQRETIEKIEDFEPMTERLVTALIENKTVDQATTVDNVTVTEAEKEPVRRTGYYSSGLLVGITYPLNGGYAYYDEDGWAWDYARGLYARQSPVERGQYVKVGWLSMFEFRNNLAFNASLLGNIPVSIGGDVDLIWFRSKTDICPFAGGGLGLHYVRSDYYPPSLESHESSRRNFGPTLNAQGGVLLFRTYNIRLMLRAQYHVIFNTDADQGVSIDAVTMYHPTPSEVKAGTAAESSGSAMLKVGALALIVVLFTAGMISYYN